MAKWRLAKGLVKLRNQIDEMHPNRSKVSDGSVGDLSHRARASDHNPNAQGVVTAVDITHDIEHGVDGNVLSQQLTADPRTKYVIFAGRIWKARTGKWETYKGPNRHDHHVHISIKPESADDVSPWLLLPSSPPVALRLTLPHMTGPAVKELQQKLIDTGYLYPGDADSVFGYKTQKAIRAFQTAKRLQADGIAGLATMKALDEEWHSTH